ncbi:MAG TPA: hypothetical protein VL547_10365 [Dinghuibacter sp.]|uniref:hypothetical protein n=1 Tax=Dinghuibacter sp. TaxID=2024697 RepID=UPI002B7B43B6|nr:hypothetical protein [Dinghuibacter sp.]HTJ12420.1 hypothetical protein [Dinghuibacter sp.]
MALRGAMMGWGAGLLLGLLSAGRLLAQDTSRASHADTLRLKADTTKTGVRLMTEGTITYKLQSADAPKPEAAILASTSYVLSLKGSRVRTDFAGILGSTTTIYSSLTHAGALLQEYGQEKILIRMNKEDFEDLGKPSRMTYTFTGDTATIAGYPCKRAIGRTPAGDTLMIWYTPDLLPQNKEYSYRFNPLPGLPLAYEGRMGPSKVTFTAVKVSLDPVPSAKFDIPKSGGYREMSYEESKKVR